MPDSKLTKGRDLIQSGWETILEGLQEAYGLDYKNDENFHDTPLRNARALLERCVGINSEEMCVELLAKSFPSEYHGMIIADPITVHGLCPHHFEDVFYKVYVGYIPGKRCVGLSKIARVAKLYGSQPILQEDYTQKLADLFHKELEADGVAVVTRGRHNCMVARGVRQVGAGVTMSELRGSFLEDPAVKAEFFTLCQLTK